MFDNIFYIIGRGFPDSGRRWGGELLCWLRKYG